MLNFGSAFINFSNGKSLSVRAGESEDTWDQNVKKVQSAINKTTNRSTWNTPAKVLYGFKPHSMADAALVSAIQETLDQVDLKKMSEVAKGSIDEEQKR